MAPKRSRAASASVPSAKKTTDKDVEEITTRLKSVKITSKMKSKAASAADPAASSTTTSTSKAGSSKTESTSTQARKGDAGLSTEDKILAAKRAANTASKALDDAA